MTTALGWSPSRRVYVRHALISTALTFLLFLVLAMMSRSAFEIDLLLTALVPAAMTAIFVIEDYSRWRALRSEHWEIEDGHLIHDSAEGRAMIPLEEISGAKKRFTGSVILRLASGQRIAMRYLENPEGVARQINGLSQNPLVHG